MRRCPIPTSPASARPPWPATRARCVPLSAAECGPWCSSAVPTSTRATASPPSSTACGRRPRPGCRAVVLTNGCGGLRPEWAPGTPVLIRDHINLTALSPLTGATFVDLTDLYSQRLRALCRTVDPSLDEGVYVQFPGPHYETPAEIAMVRAIGGDLVGMSTSLEAIAAREAGMEVLGISLVTNPAAGVTGEPLDHQEVLAAGHAAATSMGRLLASGRAEGRRPHEPPGAGDRGGRRHRYDGELGR